MDYKKFFELVKASLAPDLKEPFETDSVSATAHCLYLLYK